MFDVTLRPRDASQGAHDAQGIRAPRSRIDVWLYPRDDGRGSHDVQLRAQPLFRFVLDDPGGGGPFPTQYSGLRIQDDTGMVELCLVAMGDGATGMGGVPRIYKAGATYDLYLVETTDPDASHVRIRTTTGVKAVRVKT